MSLSVQKLSYRHPDREILFEELSFNIEKGSKIALIGNNGCGKSTLLRILAGQLSPTSGEIISSSTLFYIPQHFGQYDHLNVGDALGISARLHALHAILGGDASPEHFDALADDWNIEERVATAFSAWDISHITPELPMSQLSGGEKNRLFLAGVAIHEPDILLMDEPTNHLDAEGRKRLYDFILNTGETLLIVSHDRTLLNLLNTTLELSSRGITVYGGNYDFYKEQKSIQQTALRNQLEEKEKELRKARKVAREAAERKQRKDARGKQKLEKEGVPKIMQGAIKDSAEKSGTKLTAVHAEKMGGIQSELQQIKENLDRHNDLKMDFGHAHLHHGKRLVRARDISFAYTPDAPLWPTPLSFEIFSGERIRITGNNGSGKTTLLCLIFGELTPTTGELERVPFSYIYMDQDFSLIDDRLTVLEQLHTANRSERLDHELKTILHRFLFPEATWNKRCSQLSGGEKMRLAFASLMVSNQTPDMFVLDEPTNNLDIESLEVVTSIISSYQGTLLVISHDTYFAREIGVEREINLL